MLAPIVLFTYNRLSETKQTIESLQKNYLANESLLFVFSDGPKNDVGKEKVTAVRDYLGSVNGFRKVHIKESQINIGLANSIIYGVSEIIKEYGKAIVLEDDLITSPNFLNFMNETLNEFYNDHRIFSIAGYTPDLPALSQYPFDYYLSCRGSSWGWGTWKDRWESVDWELKEYSAFKYNLKANYQFAKGGIDLPGMLRDQVQGKINSWAIRWVYQQFKNQQLTVYPKLSKVKSVGFGANATHTKFTNRFDTKIDDGSNTKFNFSPKLEINKDLMKEFRTIFSIRKRLMDKFSKKN